LIELIVVIGIITVLMVLVAPAFTNVKRSGDLTSAAQDLVGALEAARSYAVANSTYVWIGFFEDDPTAAASTPAIAGVGRVVVSTVASADGTRIYVFTTSKVSDTEPAALDAAQWGTGRLLQIGKLLKISGIHLVPDISTLNLSAVSTQSIKPSYQVGYDGDKTKPGFNFHKVSDTASEINPTTFCYPIGSSSPAYRFIKIIEYNPRGEALKIVSDFDGPTDTIAIALQPTHGNLADAKDPNVAAITVSGLTGAARLYRK
jgi:type II secretory pathway pseudopilin PulG